jgi:CRISPR-associated protein Cmr5
MADNASIKGLEQGRAIFAYNCASAGSKEIKKKEYKSYVKKVPMLIKTNGLGETFAFINSKKSPDKNKSGYAYLLIYNQTSDWLKKDQKIKPDDNLLEKIISMDSFEYRAVTNEVIAYFKWLIRFADGLIEGEADE